MALTQNPNVGLLNQTTTSTSFVVPTPTGYAAGDLLFCVLNVDSKSASVTAPSGWTLLDDIQTSVSLGNRTRTYWKIATGAEGASQTWTISTARRGSGTMLGVTGASASSPIAAHATQNNSTSSTSQNAPSVAASGLNNALLICSVSAFINGSYTPPATMTEQADQANVDTTTTVATETFTGSSTGTRTFTASASSASIATTTAIVAAPTATAAVPPGVAVGDLLFAQAFFYNNGSVAFTITPPSGWTLIDSNTVPGFAYMQMATYYRIADGTEAASYDFIAPDASPAGSAGDAFILRYAGPWAASPLDAHGTQQTTFGTSATAPTVTVSQANSLALLSIATYPAATVATPAAGFTAAAGNAVVSNRHDALANTAMAAGATGALTSTLSSSAYNVAFIAVFTPYVSITTSTRAVPATVAIGTTGNIRAVPAALAVKTTGNVRVVPARLALKTTANTRAVPASVAVKTVANTRVAPATVAVTVATTQPARVVPAVLAIRTTTSRAVPASIAVATVGNVRVAPASLAVKITAAARVVPASVAVATTQARSVPATLAVRTTLARTVSATLAVRTTTARVVPVTLAISIGAIRSVPATLAIKTTTARAVPASLALKTTSARIVPAALALHVTATRVVPASLAIGATATRVVPASLAIDLAWQPVRLGGIAELGPVVLGVAAIEPAQTATGVAELAHVVTGEAVIEPRDVAGLANLGARLVGAATVEEF